MFLKTITVREMVEFFGGSSEERFSAEEKEIFPDFFRGPRSDYSSDEKRTKRIGERIRPFLQDADASLIVVANMYFR